MIKKIVIAFFICLSIEAQINDKALENFNSSSFQDITKFDNSDVTIIFDRSYIDIRKENGLQVYKTIHRKIKIHSLYGLENYNKLYIPIINNFKTNLEFVDCKAKVLKENKKNVTTNSDKIITTSLPANAPFFYKVKGKVRMLAIEDLNIGDEVEYIYTTKQAHDVRSFVNFYKTDRIEYTSNDYCLEKSLFIDAKKFNVKIWPYNFKNGVDRNTNFVDEENVYKVSLKNIKPSIREIYSFSYLHEPYLFYEISSFENNESDDTWEDFAKYFKPKRQDTKKNYILNGQSIQNALDELDTINSTKKKYQEILNKINKPIEDNFYLYENIKDDIDVAWGYAKIISKTAKKLQLPINFHFVISKKHGDLDKSLVNLYQFNTIICSFKNEQGKIDYFPLIEPYSTFNDIRKEYQQTECFTIKQDSEGKRTNEFGFIPLLEKGDFQKKVHITLKETKPDTLKLTVNESVKFSGHSWLEVKPIISHVIRDSVKTKKRLKIFAKNQIVLSEKIDSVYNIKYSKKEDSFSFEYQYDLSKQLKSNSHYFNISPKYFFEKDFFTPYYQKSKRINKGYFTNEFDTNYYFSFENSNNTWLENKSLKKSLSNKFGNVTSTYNDKNNIIEASIKLNFTQPEFEPQDWNEVLNLREAMYDFLNSKFYFK